MKKVIFRIVIILVIVGAIFGGKKYIDQRTYSYKTEINDALTNYFVKDDDTSLNNILNVLDKNKRNDAKRTEIQNYSYQVVGSWFTYMDQKYACDDTTYRANKNSCIDQLSEFQKLKDKLEQLYNYKSKEGYTIILPSYYNSLLSQSQKRIADLEKKVKNSRNPQSAEEERLEKCNKATECENCRDGICTCYYTANGVREGLTCKKEIEGN